MAIEFTSSIPQYRPGDLARPQDPYYADRKEDINEMGNELLSAGQVDILNDKPTYKKDGTIDTNEKSLLGRLAQSMRNSLIGGRTIAEKQGAGTSAVPGGGVLVEGARGPEEGPGTLVDHKED